MLLFIKAHLVDRGVMEVYPCSTAGAQDRANTIDPSFATDPGQFHHTTLASRPGSWPGVSLSSPA